MKVPEPKVRKNRFHLDLVTNGSMSEEVDRLVELGARLIEVRQDPESLENPDTWTVLEDLEGNVFCVTSSTTLSGWGLGAVQRRDTIPIDPTPTGGGPNTFALGRFGTNHAVWRKTKYPR